MDEYIPLGDTHYVFRISGYIIFMSVIQNAIFRILVAALAILIFAHLKNQRNQSYIYIFIHKILFFISLSL